MSGLDPVTGIPLSPNGPLPQSVPDGTPISNLPLASQLLGGEAVPMVQAGTTVQASMSNIAAFNQPPTPLPIFNGGTGKQSMTPGAIQVGGVTQQVEVPLGVKGQILIGETGAVPNWLGAGQATQLLSSNGPGADPSWVNTSVIVGQGPPGPPGPQGPQGLIQEAPLDSRLYSRFNGSWAANPIQADAPLDGAFYGRVSGAWAQGVASAGGTFSGPVTFTSNAIIATPAQFQLGGGTSGFVLRTNGAGGLSWVNPTAGGGIPDAPTDSTTYSRNNAAWVHLSHNDIVDWSSTIAAALAPYAFASSVPVPSNATPLVDGSAVPGTAATFSRADHVHPTDPSRYAASNPANYQTAGQLTAALGPYATTASVTAALVPYATNASVTASLGNYLPLAGGTLTGSLFGVAAQFSGALNANGGFNCPSAANFSNQTVFNSNLSGTYPRLDGAGVNRTLYGSTSGSLRWQLVLGNATAESGGNAGSDFFISRFNDSATLINHPLQITRSSGIVQFNIPPSTPGANMPVVDSPAGSAKGFCGSSGGVTRWSMLLGDNSAEGGANAGSLFSLTRFSDAGANLGAVMFATRTTGVVNFTAAIVNGPSDRTLKENIEPLADALAKVEALQGVSFNWRSNRRRDIGLIAQDVEPIVPEIIQPYGDDGKLALDYPKLTALLIEAVKTLSARVAALEAAK